MHTTYNSRNGQLDRDYGDDNKEQLDRDHGDDDKEQLDRDYGDDNKEYSQRLFLKRAQIALGQKALPVTVSPLMRKLLHVQRVWAEEIISRVHFFSLFFPPSPPMEGKSKETTCRLPTD